MLAPHFAFMFRCVCFLAAHLPAAHLAPHLVMLVDDPHLPWVPLISAAAAGRATMAAVSAASEASFTEAFMGFSNAGDRKSCG
ncbi:hypothetical protein RHOFW104T7_18030 [Rhodanobacter thiooxydans]|uniref:Secreted protein n=1 Tax=Rhodanobacter thiooxydans TaxID=416169 RepID=A0A154QGC7_9GAMM|nr:hypothetical protein UUA_09606 [Rhodanobacter thiooxydans LCS2]KZC22702.1 hypothetical protein RHOFW104T7_18030 [Rhodanobacter thiooxydans]